MGTNTKGFLGRYYSLTKPGIIYGNLLTVTAGFILGTRVGIELTLLAETLFGISLVIASGCVLNNIIDRDIDGLMVRTRDRVLVRKEVPLFSAYALAVSLGSIGSWILGYFTNLTTLFSALFGLFAYVFVYSLWSKRSSVHGTLLGSISGAIPPLVGYTAAMGQIDLGAAILFLLLTFWQMPHSYGVAMYRLTDYVNAHIPVLPAAKNSRITKYHMIAYVGLFVIAIFALYGFGYAGPIFLTLMLPASMLWLLLSIHGMRAVDDKQFGKHMFLASIAIITMFTIAVIIDHLWSM